MKYWFDTEFIEDGKTIELISIGIVAEDGAEFYAECAECDYDRASEWVKDNVIPHLTGEAHARADIAEDIRRWVKRGTAESGTKPEFWAYYADYDWVALCQLFGTMMDLPEGWPMYCRDLKQAVDEAGNPELPKQSSTEHHALTDAQWTKEAWYWLKENASRPVPA